MLKKYLPVIFVFAFLIVISTFFLRFLSFRQSASMLSPLIDFSPATDHQSPVTNPQSPITLVAVGDIMLGRNVNQKMIKYQNFKYPFEKTASFLSAADITFGNLESPFSKNCPVIGTGSFTFCADYRSVEGLLFAGFDVLSLENNHILNFGQAGLEQTKELLTGNNISYSDANNLTIKQFNNLSFGFLSFTYDKNLDQALAKVETEKDRVDILIVSLHWGNEYQKEPSKPQKELAHKLIEAGAKVVIGHHPHVTQPTEEYGDGLIFYSLGNFVFDQMWSQETRKGLVAKITFEEKEIKDFQTYQVLIFDYSQPNFLIQP